jgi:hypothetical protein
MSGNSCSGSRSRLIRPKITINRTETPTAIGFLNADSISLMAHTPGACGALITVSMHGSREKLPGSGRARPGCDEALPDVPEVMAGIGGRRVGSRGTGDQRSSLILSL